MLTVSNALSMSSATAIAVLVVYFGQSLLCSTVIVEWLHLKACCV